MNDGLLVIAITSPDHIPDEAERISDLLYSKEVDLVHIRKPSWDYPETKRLLSRIPPSLHSKLKLHDHFDLVNEFRLAGVHLNSRNPFPPCGATHVSRSIHSIEQLNDIRHYDYVTLSPVFDSISKNGYKSAFNLEELKKIIKGKRVVALGGVTPDRFPLLRESGFFGAAMLGHLWKATNES